MVRVVTVVALCAPVVAWAADANGDGCEDAPFLANGACIHPTATVGSGSSLGSNARLGAGSTLGPDVSVGSGAVLSPRVTIVGNAGGGAKSIGASTSVGRRSTIGADSTLGGTNTIAADVATGTHLVTEGAVVVGYGATLGDHVTLRSGAVVGNLVQLGDWADVGASASVGRGTVVADGAGAGLGARIDGDVGAGVTIGAGARIDAGARVAADADVSAGAQVGAGARVGRGAEIGADAILEEGAVVRSGATVAPTARVGTGDVVARGTTWSEGANIAGQSFTVTVGGVAMEFRGIPNTSGQPGGAFEMGCKVGRDNTDGANCVGSNEWFDGEELHPVTLTREIWVGRTEVTQAQFVALNPENHNPSHFDGSPGANAGLTAPVEQVSWHDAAWYANQVTAVHNSQFGTSLAQCYTCSGTYSATNETAPGCAPVANFVACTGYRLPTEAEWEWAARAGQSHAYSGGNTLGDVAWYGSNSGAIPHPVGTKAANGFGLYDMSGNVWEWANDSLTASAFSSAAVTDPTGLGSASSRVIRGGSWSRDPRSVRTAIRLVYDPASRINGLGFRLVRTNP